jgi:alkylhydroperoxidase/carboxymuconolactone decarboxylase family protein YurZ
MSDTPVLDTVAALTAVSIAEFTAPPAALILIRLAALVAVDAPEASYLAHVGPSLELGVTIEDVQNVLVAVAPIVGTPKVLSAAEKITNALGFAILVAEAELEAELDEADLA